MTSQDATATDTRQTHPNVWESIQAFTAPLRYGYAQIFFASSWPVAIAFMAATFVIPAQGLSGLLGLVLASAMAWLLGMPREWVKTGFFAYNGLLQGLALGLSYEINGAFFALLVITSFLGIGIAAGLRILFERYIGVPVLSLPFVLTTWLMVAAAGRFDELIYTLEPFVAGASETNLPFVAVFFAKSLGAAFFQLSVASGLLVMLGLLIYSRHAFVLAVVGLAAGSLFHLFLGGNFNDLNNMWIGFNFVLTAIAIGGMWVVPGIDSLLLAAIGAAACSIVTAASYQFLAPLGVPVLAFPFVATTIIILFALRSRIEPHLLRNIIFPAETPEANLKNARNKRARFIRDDAPSFALPISGAWTVTQGFDGEHTHRSHWAHAWDFEILDENGRAYSGNGELVQDFAAYQKPVYAPADGKVIKVINFVEDNAIGQVNHMENWGNLVILWHYGSIYTSLCHLAKGSVKVEEGETVHRGQRIGRVGNSGRSPVPHLHFQAQMSPEIGAPTTPCEILNYLVDTGQGLEYHTHNIPQKGDRLQALTTASSRFAAAGFPLGTTYSFRVNTDTAYKQETWTTDIDFVGNRFLSCEQTGAKARMYVDKNVFMVLDYTGPKDSGLFWLYLCCPRIPLTGQDVFWTDSLPGEHLLPFVNRQVFDLAEPAVSLAKISTRSCFGDTKNGSFSVETRLRFNGLLANRRYDDLSLSAVFDRRFGLVSLAVNNKGTQMFAMERDVDNDG